MLKNNSNFTFLISFSIYLLLCRKILPQILAAKKAEEAKVGVFAPSEIQKGTSREAYICCNEQLGTTCKPFPKCCDCTKQSKNEDRDITDKKALRNDRYQYISEKDIEEGLVIELLLD